MIQQELIQKPVQANHLGALTGLRFFAALAVVIGHLIADHNGNGLGRFGLPHNPMVLGGAAVSFFFVLSGFILTYVYKDQLTYAGVKKFYYKRWARIWPLHLVCLIIAIYVINIRVIRWDMFAVNLALLHSWVPDTQWVFSFNGVSWSISTEMFFYFMFPFLLIGGQKRFWIKYVIVWVVVVGAVIGMQTLSKLPDFANYNFDRAAQINPLLRLPEFCTGMAVGFLFFNRAKHRKRRSFTTDTVAEILVLSLIPIFWITYYVYFKATWVIRTADWGGSVIALWVQYASMVFVFAIVIYVFSRSHGFFAKLFGSRALVFAGEISFALYMIHFLVILAVDRYDWSGSQHSPWVLGACVIVISLSLAAFLYKLVEMPAKSGLMSLYDRGFKKAFLAFPTHLFRFLKTPTCWCYVVLLAGSIGIVRANFEPVDVDAQMQSVVAASHGPYKDVNFGELIRLMGVQATPTPQGIQLEMVWQKRAPLNRLRFLHFCDDEGNIISQLGPQKELFKEATLLKPVLEQCLLPNHKLADERITQVGIGFYAEDIDPATNKPYAMLRVSKGLRGMSDFRLYVIGQNQMKNLRKQLASLNPDAAETPAATPDESAQVESARVESARVESARVESTHVTNDTH